MIQNKILYRVFTLFLGLTTLVACQKMTDDPEGTIEGNISGNQAIDIIDGALRCFRLQWARPENFSFRPLTVSVTVDEEEDPVNVPCAQISVCEVGSVNGLGDIKTIPTTGFSSPYSDASQFYTSQGYTPGNGYIFKVELFTPDPSNPVLTGEVYYVRLYVKKSIVSTVLGVFGAKVSYQFPFVP